MCNRKAKHRNLTKFKDASENTEPAIVFSPSLYANAGDSLHHMSILCWILLNALVQAIHRCHIPGCRLSSKVRAVPSVVGRTSLRAQSTCLLPQSILTVQLRGELSTSEEQYKAPTRIHHCSPPEHFRTLQHSVAQISANLCKTPDPNLSLNQACSVSLFPWDAVEPHVYRSNS